MSAVAERVAQQSLRSIWNGTLEVAGIRAPVGLAVATQRQELAFTSIHECGRPIALRQRRECPEHGEAPAEEIVRCYEFSPGHYVPVGDEDLAEADTRLISVQRIVDADKLSPLLHDRAYYLTPTDDGPARHNYALILAALAELDAVGFASVVMRGKDHACVVSPLARVLCLTTLFLAEDVRPAGAIVKALRGHQPDPQLVSRTVSRLEELRGPPPRRLGGAYRGRVRRLLDKRVAAGDVISQPDAVRAATLDVASDL